MPPLTGKRDKASAFLLACYYRNFVPNFAAVAAPLFKLLHQDSEFRWGPPEIEALRTLKDALGSDPILSHPNFDLPFRPRRSTLPTDTKERARDQLHQQDAPRIQTTLAREGKGSVGDPLGV